MKQAKKTVFTSPRQPHAAEYRGKIMIIRKSTDFLHFVQVSSRSAIDQIFGPFFDRSR